MGKLLDKLTVTQIIFIKISIFLMIFIFLNSAATATDSSAMSGSIVAWINDVLGIPVTSFMVRKAAHFLEFAALGCSLCFACDNRRLVAVLIGIAYAVSDEIHQSFVPGRSCELRDMLIDSCGIICGVLAAWLIIRISSRRITNRND